MQFITRLRAQVRGWWIASGASAGGAHYDDSAMTLRVFNMAVKKSRFLLLELTQFEFARIIPSTFMQEGKAAGSSAYGMLNSVINKPSVTPGAACAFN